MEKPLVLVVEDEKEVAKGIADIANKSGKYSALVAYSAEEAFEVLKKHKQLLKPEQNQIGLIMLDIKMPGMDGLQFLDKLRKSYPEEVIGVIMITAYEDEEKWEKATSGYVAGYITKPFKEKALLAKLDEFFSSEKAKLKMVLDTFEEHIDKRDGLEHKRTPF